MQKKRERMSIEDDIRALATDRGRAVGTDGHHAARSYLLQKLQNMDMAPYLPEGFEASYESAGELYHNIVAMMPGRDPSLEPILLGAHYDTCGSFPGADDNAAAVAIILDVAAEMAHVSRDRSVVLALFDAEEPPNFLSQSMGSIRFYEDQRLTGFHCALILDLVGHDLPVPGLEDLLFVMGMETDYGLGEVIKDCPAGPSIRVLPTLSRYVGDMSDHHVFRVNHVPYLFLSCGTWEHYHQPTDTPEKLNYGKIEAISRYLLAIASAISMKQLSGPFEGYDSTDIELDYIHSVIYPVMEQMGRPIRVNDRRDIDWFADMMMGYLGG